MFKSVFTVLAAAAALFAAAPAFANAEIGQPAPDFMATDAAGQPFKLSDHLGKTIVLEWTNHQCPFVIKHYDTGNMQKTQESAVAQGAEWVTIISSAPGKQGHVSAEEALKIAEEAGAHQSVKILDESGEIGQMYGAQTTPHMYVINAQGMLVYAGAIDNNSSPRHDTVEGATNYVLAALDDIAAGRPVGVSQTQPYGCSVKY